MHAEQSLAVLALLALAPVPGVAVQVSGIATTRLEPGDRVRVEVAGDSTLSGDFDVDADGWVLVPVAGLVRAVDRPFSDVALDITRAFSDEFLDLAVRTVPLARVAVLGEVETPGLFWIDPTMMLADVLAHSGGLTEAAREDDVRVQRGGSVLLLSANHAEPVPLRSGDRVFVGRRSFVSRNAPILLGAGTSILAAVLTAVILR
jgi:polysaccharide export outer membrane protein